MVKSSNFIFSVNRSRRGIGSRHPKSIMLSSQLLQALGRLGKLPRTGRSRP